MCRRPDYLITIKINVQNYTIPPHNNVLYSRYDHDFFVCNNINTSSGGGLKYQI